MERQRSGHSTKLRLAGAGCGTRTSCPAPTMLHMLSRHTIGCTQSRQTTTFVVVLALTVWDLQGNAPPQRHGIRFSTTDSQQLSNYHVPDPEKAMSTARVIRCSTSCTEVRTQCGTRPMRQLTAHSVDEDPVRQPPAPKVRRHFYSQLLCSRILLHCSTQSSGIVELR